MRNDRLRRAADLMREQHGPDHERHEMWSAMADWMDSTARYVDRGNLPRSRDLHAFRVARAYLGDT